MKENFGNGWVGRGPRTAVAVWDDDMQSCKAVRDELPWQELGYSELPNE